MPGLALANELVSMLDDEELELHVQFCHQARMARARRPIDQDEMEPRRSPPPIRDTIPSPRE